MSTDIDRISEEGTSGSVADTLKELTTGFTGEDFRVAEGGETDDAPTDRTRDEQGRFAPKQETTGEQPQAQPQIQPDHQPEAVKPPMSWSKEQQAVFAALPPDVQRIISDRDKATHDAFLQKTSEIADIKRFSDEVRPIIDRYQPLIAQTGAPAGQVLDELFRIYEFSNRDPAGYLKWAAQSMGVDLSTLNQAPDEYVDPGLSELRGQQSQLAQQVQSVASWIQQQTQERQVSEIRAFADEKDAQGNLTHPHIGNVWQKMAQLQEKGLASTLQEAYDMAAWSDPSIREQLTRPKQPDETVENAKRVQSMNVKAKGVGPAADTATGSIRDTLRDQMSRLG